MSEEHMTLAEVHHYWRNPGKQNAPDAYVRPIERSQFLLKRLQEQEVDLEWSILEIGCNVGRNLNALYEAGYRNLTGIEISGRAWRRMHVHYPDMARSTPVHVSPMEVVLPTLTKPFDLVFTMAVLEHVHDESAHQVLWEIQRLTSKTLITIEDERSTGRRHFPRNYRWLFENLGFVQHHELENSTLFAGPYVCRVLRKRAQE